MSEKRNILFKGFIGSTAKKEDDFSQKGIFLGWGIDYEIWNDLPLHSTVAIVEKEDGTIRFVGVDAIKFINN